MSLVTPRKGYKSVPWLFGKEIEIPEEWEVTTLKENSYVTDGSHLTPVKIRKGFPMATVENLKYSSIDIDSCYNISEEDFKQLTKNNCKPEINDVLFTKDGTVGKSFVFTQNIDVVLLSSIAILRPFENLDSYFLHYLFHSEAMTKFVAKFLGGTAIKRIVLKHLEIFYFPLPPLPEQQKITTILSNVDNLIESTEKVITHSKKVKNGLMQKLLTRGIGHVTFKKVPWLFGKEIEIPEEWENVNVEYVADKLLSGGTPSTMITEYWDGDIPWTKGAILTTNNTTKGEKFISELGLKNSSTSIISKDNLLVVSRVSIGNISINKIDVAINQDITAVILNKTICLTDFLYWNLLQTINILVSFSQGTTIQGFTRKDLSSHKVLLPSLPEQQKIATILSNIDSKITSQEQYKEKLQKLKKSLMQKLLLGEVRVKI